MGPNTANPHGEVPERVARRAWRRAVVLVVPLLYVAGNAAAAGETSSQAWLAIAIAVVIALGSSLVRSGETPASVRTRLWTSAALSISVASLAPSGRWAWLAFAREIALLGSSAAAVRAIGAIDGDPGLAASATEAAAARGMGPRALGRIAMAIVVAAWGSAAIADGLTWAGLTSSFADVAPLFASVSGAAALFGIGAFALLTSAARSLELSPPPRALACAAAAGTGLLFTIALALTTNVHAESAAALGAALTCPVVIRIARAGDALAVARRGRRVLTLALYGGPVATLAALSAEGHVAGVGIVALVLALVAMVIGTLAPKLEEPLLPAKGRLLDAFEEASRAAHDREARTAIAKALVHLREAAGHGAPSPELWILHPTRVYTVDAAGYLQVTPGELPTALLDVARGEPGGTIRVDVLSALEVRRADLRPLLRWLEVRGMLFATLVAGADGEEPDGVVLVPAGARTDPLSIDEVAAAKLFAAAFVAVCQARSAHDRHLAREQALVDKVDALDDALAALRHAQTLDASRNVLASSHLARAATVGIYSAASRMAYDALERRLQSDAPVVIVASAGVDPVPQLARAHLAGPRRERPLVIVDGTSSREHDLARWREASSSPIALADRGLLVLLDGAALPRDVQALVARALSERRAPWEQATALDVAIAFTSTSSPEHLVENGLLAPELYARFEDAKPIELARLRDRSEDLFSIVADRLAREGLRVRGAPVGIDAAAFARLVEHPFDGGDAELASIVTRLVARLVAQTSSDVVRASDMDAIGFVKTEENEHRSDDAYVATETSGVCDA